MLHAFEPYQWEPPTQEIASEHGLEEQSIIRFDTSTSPQMPSSWIDELSSNLSSLGINEYPDTSYKSLRVGLSKYSGLGEHCIMVTAGGDESLDIIAKGILDHDSKAIASVPTYSLYRIVAEVMGGKLIEVPRRGDFSDDYDQILSRIDGDTRIIFLCSPNNPTGNSSHATGVERLLRESACAVVVDEAYVEFSGKSVAQLAKNYANLLVVRTFSKAFAMAGARVGYTLGSEETIKALNKVRPPNSVSVVSLALAEIALRHVGDMRTSVARMVAERERMAARLGSIAGVQVYSSDANFLLLRLLNMNARDVWSNLLGMGMVVRSLADIRGLENCLRLGVRLPEQNDRLIQAMEKLFGS